MKGAILREDAGAILRRAREAKKQTQTQVAKAIGADQSTYCRLEVRPGSAHAQTFLAALIYLGLKTEDVLI